VLAAAALGLAPAAAHACSLAAPQGPPPTLPQRVHALDVAFTGTITTVAPLGPSPDAFGGTRATIAVDRVLKGAVPPAIDVAVSSFGCSGSLLPAGARIGVVMSPRTPPPWRPGVGETLAAEALDALPPDAAYRRTPVTGFAQDPARRYLEVHFRAPACASVRGRLQETAHAIAPALSIAAGPGCVAGRAADRCVAFLPSAPLGTRTLRPRAARRVAGLPVERCPALAS
jgi:hypothetical protein